jgi:cupin superfamily acireductone dioxygenase involved in methionine salvage
MSVILPFLKIFNIKLDNMHTFDDMLEQQLKDVRPFFENGKWNALTYSNEVADKFLKALYNEYIELDNKYPTMNYKTNGKIAVMVILKDNPQWTPYFKQSQYYNKLVSL